MMSRRVFLYRLKSQLGILLLAAALLAVSVATFTYPYLVPSKETTLPVIGIPPQAQSPGQPSYSGPHPSSMQRPEETYPFPIRLGQIGPIEGLFSGPLQYPFLCGVQKSGLGQPIVDNHQGWGIPVYQLTKQGTPGDSIAGYSKDCLVPTQASYFYNRTGTEKFFPLSQANNDIQKISVNGKSVDFIVRVETGVINRFIYVIVALKGEGETLTDPSPSHWNKKLIYQFRGGVGIGYRQGRATANIIFKRRYDQLAEGYAVVYSTGTQTSNHYNMWRSEDVALRVKKQFTALYGKPKYTIGIGGSGGAVQQLLLAQNNPHIIDAAIAEYAYPDMVSQTAYAMDCELLEYYFDVTDSKNPRWQQWSNRQLIEGMNASEQQENPFRWLQRVAQIRAGTSPSWQTGNSECVNGWRGLTPLVHNPTFTHLAKYYDADVVKQVRWSHWNDLHNIYGTDEQGYGHTAWDNVGVQYGLRALREGKLPPEEFLQLNASVGGWKPQSNMRDEQFWFLDKGFFPIRISVWSHRNMYTGTLQQPAVRSSASLKAIEAAYRSGHIFLGHLDIPVIDLRHYLEDELDMHHLAASFSIRQRLQKAQGHSDNHLIWVTEKPHKGEAEAFALLDQWLNTEHDDRPATAIDTCFDVQGFVLAAGDRVWDGPWNERPAGACSRVYPAYSVSRYQAGDNIAGDILKCALQPVDQAMSSGLYGSIDMSPHVASLKNIFPNGVCDYTLADVGRPEALLAGSRFLPSPTNQEQLLVNKNEKRPRPAPAQSNEPIELTLQNEAFVPDNQQPNRL